MELLLQRKIFNSSNTIGDLFINNNLFCHTVEDKDRRLEIAGNVKINNDTCIPRGRYQVIIDHSNRFKKDMPHILNVPKFEGIRIHTGNTEADTEGCVIVGETIDSNIQVLNSKKAFNRLFPILQETLKTENIFITIK